MKTKRVLILALSIFLFFAVIILLDESSYHENSDQGITFNNQAEITKTLPKVSYIQLAPTQETLILEAHGELKPKWDIEIKSQVSGEIIALSPKAKVGIRVGTETPLVTVDARPYQARADESQVQLEQAKLDLLQAQHRTKLARADWQRSGLSTPPSDLMLFKPQLSIAEHRLTSASSHYTLALKTLRDTSISAPFEGLITARYVAKGQILNEGDPLFRLVDDQSLRITISLGEHQRALLSLDWKNTPVSMYSSDNLLVGEATLSRGGDIIDETTRQYFFHLDVSPEQRKKARAGQFVTLELPGKLITNVLNLPESCLTQNGSVWLIREDDRLEEYIPERLFRHKDRILVSPPDEPLHTQKSKIQGYRIALHAMSYFLTGHRVTPVLSN